MQISSLYRDIRVHVYTYTICISALLFSTPELRHWAAPDSARAADPGSTGGGGDSPGTQHVGVRGGDPQPPAVPQIRRAGQGQQLLRRGRVLREIRLRDQRKRWALVFVFLLHSTTFIKMYQVSLLISLYYADQIMTSRAHTPSLYHWRASGVTEFPRVPFPASLLLLTHAVLNFICCYAPEEEWKQPSPPLFYAHLFWLSVSTRGSIIEQQWQLYQVHYRHGGFTSHLGLLQDTIPSYVQSERKVCSFISWMLPFGTSIFAPSIRTKKFQNFGGVKVSIFAKTVHTCLQMLHNARFQCLFHKTFFYPLWTWKIETEVNSKKTHPNPFTFTSLQTALFVYLALLDIGKTLGKAGGNGFEKDAAECDSVNSASTLTQPFFCSTSPRKGRLCQKKELSSSSCCVLPSQGFFLGGGEVMAWFARKSSQTPPKFIPAASILFFAHTSFLIVVFIFFLTPSTKLLLRFLPGKKGFVFIIISVNRQRRR